MKRIWIFLITVTVILVTLYYGLVNMNQPLVKSVSSNNIISPKSNGKYLGEIESIIEYGDHSVIGAHFPLFGIEDVDLVTKNWILLHIEEFKDLVKNHSPEDNNYKSELSIDYEIHQFSDDIISIQFTVLESMSYYAYPYISVFTKTYDLKNKIPVQLSDIMIDNYLDKISDLSIDYFNNDVRYEKYTDTYMFYEGSLPNLQNYNNFILGKDKITFIFQRNQLFPGSLGNPIVEIAYSELSNCLNQYFIDKMPVVIVSSQHNTDLTFLDSELASIDRPPREITPSRPMVALTFDDGPNKNTTVPILDTLKQHDAVATFFVLGNRVSYNQDVLKRMVFEGSEIGNHSYNHKQLTNITSSEVKEQIDKTQDAIMEVIGSKPTLMRPTYGSYNDTLKSEIEMPMILWSVDTLDWKSRDAKKVSEHVLSNVKDGDIILMHDIYASTADATKIIVPELINRGYQLVTISELYEFREEALEVGNIYHNSYKE